MIENETTRLKHTIYSELYGEMRKVLDDKQITAETTQEELFFLMFRAVERCMERCEAQRLKIPYMVDYSESEFLSIETLEN